MFAPTSMLAPQDLVVNQKLQEHWLCAVISGLGFMIYSLLFQSLSSKQTTLTNRAEGKARATNVGVDRRLLTMCFTHYDNKVCKASVEPTHKAYVVWI